MSIRFKFPELWIKDKIKRDTFTKDLAAFLNARKLYSALTSVEVHKEYVKAKLNDKTEITLKINALSFNREPARVIIYNAYLDKRSESVVPKEELTALCGHFKILQENVYSNNQVNQHVSMYRGG